MQVGGWAPDVMRIERQAAQRPKGDGTSRPVAISTVEDKIVQGALREVLEAVYELGSR